jgi:hypothetical protein
MIRRIRRAIVLLFATPPETFRREAPAPRQAHPEPPPRSMVANLRARGYELIHYHRDEPSRACNCPTPDGHPWADRSTGLMPPRPPRDTPDGQL